MLGICALTIGIFLIRSFGVRTAIADSMYTGVGFFLEKAQNVKSTFITRIDPHYSERGLIDALRTEVRTLQTENAYYKQVEVENKSLRSALNFKTKTAFSLISAHIIGTSLELDSNLLILDKGSNDGILKGAAVIAEGGVFTGTIVSVQPSISFLQLLNDDRSSVIVSLFKNGTELSGIAHGRFRIGIVIDKIQQTVPIEAGDIVTTSSLNNGIPSGLLLGTVRDVTSSANDLFQEATLSPAIPYDRLRIVHVLAR